MLRQNVINEQVGGLLCFSWPLLIVGLLLCSCLCGSLWGPLQRWLWLLYLINLSILYVLTAFGVDAAFSYKYNQQLGVCDKDGLAICSGFTTSHVIPVCFTNLDFFLPKFFSNGVLPIKF